MEKNTKWQHQPRWNGEFSWVNTSFLIITPLLTLALLPVYLSYSFAWADFAIFSVMIFATGFSITAGYHRLFSHQTYESAWIVRLFFLVFGAGGFQNSCFKWSSDHRYHHRFVDKESDPYNINRGFFYAHMGWIFRHDPVERSYANAADLENDPLVAWQHRYYLPLAVTVAFILPTFMGWMVGRTFGGFFLGGMIRLLVLHHGTFFINSLAHMVGNRPYSTKVSARDCWWLAFFTNGEGYHNFHHAFANDYRNGLRWYQWDPTKWLIRGLNMVGLSSNLVRTPDAHILKAKLEVSSELLEQGWEIPAQVEAMRVAIEQHLQDFQKKLREFQAWREAMLQEGKRHHRARARYWAKRLRAERRVLEQSLNEYRWMVRQLQNGRTAAFA